MLQMEQEYGHKLLFQLHRREHVQMGERVHMSWLQWYVQKPWPFGNEYHDTGCADCDIIWGVDLREGKDRPRNLGNKEFDEMGKTRNSLATHQTFLAFRESL